LLPLLFGTVLAGGCVVDTTGSSSSTSSTCDQECIDSYTGFGVHEIVRFLYNQNFAGQPVGTQDTTAACALGGQAVITGTTGYDSVNAITSVDLTYAMQSCENSDGSSFDLTLTGSVVENGTFSDSTTALTFISSSLVIVGDANAETVSETCDVNVVRSGSSISGTICGRSFTY
jgi:hypothetical protein